MAEVAPEGKEQEAMMEAINKGHFTLRTMYDQLSNLQKLGPVSFEFCFSRLRFLVEVEQTSKNKTLKKKNRNIKNR